MEKPSAANMPDSTLKAARQIPTQQISRPRGGRAPSMIWNVAKSCRPGTANRRSPPWASKTSRKFHVPAGTSRNGQTQCQSNEPIAESGPPCRHDRVTINVNHKIARKVRRAAALSTQQPNDKGKGRFPRPAVGYHAVIENRDTESPNPGSGEMKIFVGIPIAGNIRMPWARMTKAASATATPRNGQTGV